MNPMMNQQTNMNIGMKAGMNPGMDMGAGMNPGMGMNSGMNTNYGPICKVCSFYQIKAQDILALIKCVLLAMAIGFVKIGIQLLR